MLDGWKKIADGPLKICYRIPYVIVAGLTIFLIFYWKHIPDQVPMHWNGAGEIDHYSSVGGYLMLVIFMYFMLAFHALMTCVIPSCTAKENLFDRETAARATEEDRLKAAKAVLYFLGETDIAMELMFAYIIISGVLVRNLGAWFLPAVCVVLGGIFAWFLWKMHRIKKEICCP